MKRSAGTPRLVPLDLIEAARDARTPRIQNASPREKRERDWFKIENKKAAAEADVYIYDEIGFWGTSAADFAQQLRDLDVTQINLHLNSPGGEVFDGVAIYNTLVGHKAKVTVMVDGLAASAASFIAQAGDEVIMGLGSTMMIHDASGLAWGNAEEMRQTASILDKLSDTISEFYANRAGGDAATWRGVMQAETWYNAQEAVDAGLADRMSESKDDGGEAVEDRWDLSVFNYEGRSAAPSPEHVRQTVMNRVTKENAVVPIQNSETTPQPPEPPPAVVVAPGTDGVQPAVAPVVEPIEPQAEDAESVPPAPVEQTDGGNQPEPITPQNLAGLSVIVNGVATSDPRAVQAHIDTLESFAKESKAAGREKFVRDLAADGKMGAPQVDSQLALVALLNDAQWETFKASWDAAPKLPMFGKHGVQDSSEPKSEKKDRLKVVTDIVKHHRDSGMSEEILKTKDSYAEMLTLQAELAGES